MRDYSAACCVQPPAVPDNYYCLWPDIVKEYCRLRKRHQNMVTKRQRIWMLSEPKIRNPKYTGQCICPESALRKVQIVRMEEPMHTRTEQLAYPQVSRLVGLKSRRSFRGFNKKRKYFVNRMLRKSLCSLYSRLSNIQPPMHPSSSGKWESTDWEHHMKRIKDLAQPKKDASEEIQSYQSIGNFRGRSARDGGKTLRRFMKLARPKQYEDMSAKEWQLTEEMKNYRPTPRIAKMSEPKSYADYDPEEAFRVKKPALFYKASQRIIEMSEPRIIHARDRDRSSVFEVKRKALKTIVSPRIVELAKPRDYYESHNRSNAFKVSPKALKAKLTPRLNELAKPKTRTAN